MEVYKFKDKVYQEKCSNAEEVFNFIKNSHQLFIILSNPQLIEEGAD